MWGVFTGFTCTLHAYASTKAAAGTESYKTNLLIRAPKVQAASYGMVCCKLEAAVVLQQHEKMLACHNVSLFSGIEMSKKLLNMGSPVSHDITSHPR